MHRLKCRTKPELCILTLLVKADQCSSSMDSRRLWKEEGSRVERDVSSKWQPKQNSISGIDSLATVGESQTILLVGSFPLRSSRQPFDNVKLPLDQAEDGQDVTLHLR